ncbi:MAG TPA: hypothetical protein VFD92_15180 [Candidatus Binatia bacterium]|nr:hypothetical protein [Candidatus Binatia bacterium]
MRAATASAAADGAAAPSGRVRRLPRPRAALLLASAVAYAAVFAVLAWPWLRVANDSLPRSRGTPFVYADDARFIAFVVGWVAHAVAHEPLRLYDAPIHHPAPLQLAGSEHFLASQLVAGPVFWATGNAVLAANAAALVSYPAAAVAAQALLLELGAAAGPAWVGGLLFALGPLRVPASLQILQYLNVFLPLLAWAITRLRRRPSRARAAVLAVCLTIGALSSYHMAAMLAVVGAVWAALALLDPAPGRGLFAQRAIAASAVALAAVAVVSIPYFVRPEAHDAALLGTLGIRQPGTVADTVKWFAVLAPILFGAPALALAAAGLAIALTRGSPTARRLARWGALLVLVGGVLMLPPEPVRAAIDHSPLRFLRAPWRFVAVAGLGTAMLATALLEWLGSRSVALGRAGLALAAALALFHGRRLVENGVDPIPALAFDRPLYEAVARAASAGGSGPLLELPVRDAAGEGARSDVPRALTDPDAMVGVTLHGQPLVTGRTGYAPAHRRMIDEMILRLPSGDALQELVDATHLRWLLLRPEGYWDRIAVRRRLLALPGVAPVLERDGWTLARVDLPPGREGWYRAIAHPDPRRASPLGTPLAPLPEGAAAEVAVSGLPSALRAGSIVPMDVEVVNAGTAPWPVPAFVGVRLGVFVAAIWRPVAGGEPPPGQSFTLPRDLAPGERASESVLLKVPPAPGEYELEVLVKQWDGARFTAPANRPFRMRVAVAPRSARQSGVAPPDAALEGAAGRGAGEPGAASAPPP